MSSTRAYIGASLIAIAGILVWALVVPMYDTITAQNDALQERTSILEKRNGILANINALTKQYASHSMDIQRFASIVPAQKSVPELISAIQALASQNGLQMTTISLSGNENQDKNPYHAQSIDLGLTGTYPAFKSFLLALEKNIRLIDIVALDASPTSETSTAIGFRIKGNAYYLK
jgi:Tfp pilus assembly protein PilO